MNDKRDNGFTAIAFFILLAGIFAIFVGLVVWYKGTLDKEKEAKEKEAYESIRENAPSVRTWNDKAGEDISPEDSVNAVHFTIKNPEKEERAPAEASEVKEETQPETEAKDTEEDTELSEQDVYADVLSIYEEAYKNGWKEKEDVSPLWAWDKTKVNMELAGYQLLDLNGDGSSELLVSAVQEAPSDSLILDLYTIKDGKARRVLFSDEKTTWFLCRDNHLLFYTSDGDDTAKIGNYILDKETAEPVSKEILLYDGITYPEYEALYSDETGYDPNYYDEGLSETMSPLSGDSANVVYDRLTGERIPLELTLFSEQ